MDQQRTQWFSLYHSLQHYKYHTYLMCKDEVRACFTLLHLVLSCVEWLGLGLGLGMVAKSEWIYL